MCVYVCVGASSVAAAGEFVCAWCRMTSKNRKKMCYTHVFSPCQSLAYLEIHVCAFVCVSMRVCVCRRERETVLRGFV